MSDKNTSRPYGTFSFFYQPIYQYFVPYGTVPEELNIGRIKKSPRNNKSRRDEIYHALHVFCLFYPDNSEFFSKISI